MRDVHTCSIGGANLIMTTIWLLGGELAHLTRQVIGSSRVHVPRRINGVGRSVPVLVTRHCSGSLLVIALVIVANAEEVLLEASMTAGGDMALKATQLASLLSAAAGATGARATTARDGRRGRPRSLLR